MSIITQEELIRRIRSRLESGSRRSTYSHFDVAPPAATAATYALILGAGFSYGVVPLVRELMHETIGDYYYPDLDTWGKRSTGVLKKNSASFWRELTRAAAGLSSVELDRNGLPSNPGAAYQTLFAGDGANALFAQPLPKGKPSYLDRMMEARSSPTALAVKRLLLEKEETRRKAGEAFVKGFLRYVLDPGAEHGYGSTGRSELNSAHIHLAAILEAQQRGTGWTGGAFSRLLITTNFDTLLQNCLQMVNLLYRITDRPEGGLDISEFQGDEGPIHLVYVHGSILRHNPANTEGELAALEERNADVLRFCLESRDIIIVGYSGWNDCLMSALRRCDSNKHMIYWCDVAPEPTPHVASLLTQRADGAAYVRLGQTGADGLMRSLYEALVPAEARRDPLQLYGDWIALTRFRPRYE